MSQLIVVFDDGTDQVRYQIDISKNEINTSLGNGIVTTARFLGAPDNMWCKLNNKSFQAVGDNIDLVKNDVTEYLKSLHPNMKCITF